MTDTHWLPWVMMVAAFLIGSFPSALIVARRLGVDLRRVGSGNPGATNVYRAIGPKPGLTVLAMDMAKGALAVALAVGAGLASGWQLAAAAAAVAGHIVSPFMGFRGGKGVATGGGAVIGLAPLVGAVVIVVFVVTLALTRIVSAASIAAAITLPLVVAVAGPPIPGFLSMSILVAAIVLVRHRANVGRLLRGEENHFELRRKSKP
jgi:glycerol-3-phosphate acyltransferase PlsY